MGLLAAEVDLRYLEQWVYLLALPNISDMLAIFHDLGRLIVKTQSAYFSNISDVLREPAMKPNVDMQQHIGYVRRQI